MGKAILAYFMLCLENFQLNLKGDAQGQVMMWYNVSHLVTKVNNKLRKLHLHSMLGAGTMKDGDMWQDLIAHLCWDLD